jgi:hypothetical protein
MPPNASFWDSPYDLMYETKGLLMQCGFSEWDVQTVSTSLGFVWPKLWTNNTLGLWRRAYAILKQLKYRIQHKQTTDKDNELYHRVNERRKTNGLKETVLPKSI